jgi:hypothetical protein
MASLRKVFGKNDETPKAAICGGCEKHLTLSPRNTTRVIWEESYPEPIIEYCHNDCLAKVIEMGRRS